MSGDLSTVRDAKVLVLLVRGARMSVVVEPVRERESAVREVLALDSILASFLASVLVTGVVKGVSRMRAQVQNLVLPWLVRCWWVGLKAPQVPEAARLPAIAGNC